MVVDERVCPRCWGDGYVQVFEDMEEITCPICLGDGFVINNNK